MNDYTAAPASSFVTFWLWGDIFDPRSVFALWPNGKITNGAGEILREAAELLTEEKEQP